MDYLWSPGRRAFFLREIHGDAVPDDVVAVSEERHEQLLNPPDGQTIGSDPSGAPVWVAAGEPAVSLADAVDWARQRIRGGAQLEADAIIAEYPAVERDTWPYQRAEAQAYLLDDASPVPVLSAILAARVDGGEQMTLAELVQKVIDKAANFDVLGGQISGRRQRLDDQLKQLEAAGDVSGIQALDW